jgi:hypothetical protein
MAWYGSGSPIARLIIQSIPLTFHPARLNDGCEGRPRWDRDLLGIGWRDGNLLGIGRWWNAAPEYDQCADQDDS